MVIITCGMLYSSCRSGCISMVLCQCLPTDNTCLPCRYYSLERSIPSNTVLRMFCNAGQPKTAERENAECRKMAVKIIVIPAGIGQLIQFPPALLHFLFLRKAMYGYFDSGCWKHRNFVSCFGSFGSGKISHYFLHMIPQLSSDVMAFASALVL